MSAFQCRSCGAPIIWVRMKSGKSMPCDPEPIYYRPGGSVKLVSSGGEVVSCTPVDNPAESDLWGYMPHWSTCNNPNKFRKGR